MTSHDTSSVEKLDQLLHDGAITEDDYHQLWNAIRGGTASHKPAATADKAAGKRLTKSLHDGALCGVCAGVAKRLGVDPVVVRLVFGLIPVFSLVLGYLMIIPCMIYLVLAIRLPWDDPEAGEAFRRHGRVPAFVATFAVLAFLAPYAFGHIAYTQLLPAYESANMGVWSSAFQSTWSGRAIDCLMAYVTFPTIPAAILAICSTFVMWAVYRNLCNAKFRRGLAAFVVGGGTAWVLFLVLGTLYPLTLI